MKINPLNIEVKHNIAANRFEVILEDKKAVLIYNIKASLFIILHTEVPPAFEGHGIAAKMTQAALNFAKTEGYKVRSYCTYTTLYIERHPEYVSLLG